jgi:coenzyme PQQ biosynthesis protein PqqD
VIAAGDRIRLAPLARLRVDERTKGWLLVYPERGLALSATAGDILNLCDGVRTVTDVANALAQKYDQSNPEELTRDVVTFLETMQGRGLVEHV